MVLRMAPVDRSLWRIAELSSHCSDPSWPGDKDEAWSALQEAIAEVRGLVVATTAAIEAAELRAARAEGRIRVVRRERDRERAARQALRAAAQVAQEKARSAREKARASQARAEQAQAALEAALGAREAAETALRWALERSDDATAARARAEAERDEVRAAFAALQAARQAAETDLARARAAIQAAEVAGQELAARDAERKAEAAGAAPEPGPALPESAAILGPDEGQPAVVDITVGAEDVPGAVERYLHVAATMGHLLPEDFAGLLVDGASLVRREGRLAALISVPTEENSEWAAPHPVAEEQAQRLAAEGFRVQWVQEICLAS